MAKKQGNSPEPTPGKKRGRPKAGGKIGFRFSIVASPEYRVWMEEFRKLLGEDKEVSDVFRDGVKCLAESRGFREPPKL